MTTGLSACPRCGAASDGGGAPGAVLDHRGFSTAVEDGSLTFRVRGAGVGPGYLASQLFLGAVLGFILDMLAGSGGIATLSGMLLFFLITLVIAAVRFRDQTFSLEGGDIVKDDLRMPVDGISEVLLYNKHLGGEVTGAKRQGNGFFIVGTGVTGVSLVVGAALSNAASALGSDMRRIRKRSLAKRGNQLCVRLGAKRVPLASHLRQDQAVSLFESLTETLEKPAAAARSAAAGSSPATPAPRGFARRMPAYNALDATRYRLLVAVLAVAVVDSLAGLLNSLVGGAGAGWLASAFALVNTVSHVAWIALAGLLILQARHKRPEFMGLLGLCVAIKSVVLVAGGGLWLSALSPFALVAFWAALASVELRQGPGVRLFSYGGLSVLWLIWSVLFARMLYALDSGAGHVPVPFGTQLVVAGCLLQIACLYQLWRQLAPRPAS
ncbi:hypothetical protein [Parahaliea mediterranea]|uniref:Uncharacterized protein n=1 Tax=Parahaliea mediterranea TaxID=651086 RepID=A0A939DGG9_9GAMM|nr:hypothetical protein [Parahaliea mediterranea]MBN7797828.1 hypothetical protein [Parahaliea mediterranea]